CHGYDVVLRIAGNTEASRNLVGRAIRGGRPTHDELLRARRAFERVLIFGSVLGPSPVGSRRTQLASAGVVEALGLHGPIELRLVDGQPSIDVVEVDHGALEPPADRPLDHASAGARRNDVAAHLAARGPRLLGSGSHAISELSKAVGSAAALFPLRT